MRDHLLRPENRDQDQEKKTKFVRTAKVGEITRLSAYGISNGKVRKLAKSYFAEGRAFEEVLQDCDHMFRSAKYTEEHVFVFYLIELYKKSLTTDTFSVADQWIDLIDHWISSDHLSMNAMRHYPIERHIDEIRTWTDSENFWRRRQSVTICLKHFDKAEIQALALENIGELIDDRNYYVRKSLTWVLRVCSKSNKEDVKNFINEHRRKFGKTELKEASKYVT